MTEPTILQLRRSALAVSVLHDLDLLPTEDGVLLTAPPSALVPWEEVADALRGQPAETAEGRAAIAGRLILHRWLADRPLPELEELVRPVALPRDHVLHPGPDWVRTPVLGGSLDLGVGFVGLDPDEPDRVVITPASTLAVAGIDVTPWWDRCLRYLEDMGSLAVARWRRDPTQPLRPLGDCDVVTLLASATLRAALVDGSAQGMHAAMIPMRRRGWVELSRIDPAFCVAAAAATVPADRGFPRPVLITVDEVVMVAEGGKPAEIVLRDTAAPTRRLDSPLYL